MLIGLTQQVSEFVIASPLGRSNLLVKCCDNRRSTRRFPRRSAPRNDRLAVCLNKADKHILHYRIMESAHSTPVTPAPAAPHTGPLWSHFRFRLPGLSK